MTDAFSRAVELLSSNPGALSTVDRRAVVQHVYENVGAVAGQRHPLGFLHINVTPLLRGALDALRLHIWSQGFSVADGLGQAHDHTWTLCSFVVCGELTDTTLRPVTDAAGAYGLFDVHYGQSADDLVMRPERFRLETVQQRQVTAGTSYRIEAGEVHETRIAKLPTATLVAAMGTERRRPRVFTTIDARPGETVVSERKEVDREQIAAELASLLVAMDE